MRSVPPHRPPVAPTALTPPPAPAVQRLPSPTPGSAIGALAAAASATVASTLGQLRPAPEPARQAQRPPHPQEPPPRYEPPPPYEPPGGRPAAVSPAPPPPEYTAVNAAAFDPRGLTEFQLDELVHRIIDRVTRLVRAELRMDRERIGRLRDPRA